MDNAARSLTLTHSHWSLRARTQGVSLM